MTDEQIAAHEEAGESFHVPTHIEKDKIVGLYSTCGICGCLIAESKVRRGLWLEVVSN